MRVGETTFERLPRGLRLYLRRLCAALCLGLTVASLLDDIGRLLDVLDEQRRHRARVATRHATERAAERAADYLRRSRGAV